MTLGAPGDPAFPAPPLMTVLFGCTFCDGAYPLTVIFCGFKLTGAPILPVCCRVSVVEGVQPLWGWTFEESNETLGRLFKVSIPPFFWMKVDRVRKRYLNSETWSRVWRKSSSSFLFFCWAFLYFLSMIWRSFWSDSFIYWYISLSSSFCLSVVRSFPRVVCKLSSCLSALDLSLCLESSSLASFSCYLSVLIFIS